MVDSAEIGIGVVDTLGVDKVEICAAKGRALVVIGDNHSGKTSLVTAVRAVLAREPDPLGLGKAKKAYLREGEKEGRAWIEAPDRDHKEDPSVRWVLPEGKIKVSGQGAPRQEPAEAIGLVDFLAMRPGKDRKEFWERVLMPVAEDDLMGSVRFALTERLPSTAVDAAMVEIEEVGLDKALSIFTARRLRSRKEWAELAGEAYGSKKADNWRPRGWNPDWEGAVLESVVREWQEAREKLAEARGAAGATEQLAEAKSRLPDLRRVLQETAETGKMARGVLDERNASVEANHADLRKLDEQVKEAGRQVEATMPTALTCPECNAALRLDHDALCPFDLEKAKRENSDAEKRFGELSEQLKERGVVADEEVRKQKDAMAMVQELIKRHNETAAEIKALEKVLEAAPGEGAEIHIDALEARVRELEAKKEAVGQKEACHRAAVAALKDGAVVDVLGPGGVREDYAARAIEKLHTALSEYSDFFGDWRLTSDYGLEMEDDEEWRPVELCSGSERWRGQAALQVALMHFQKSNWGVFDGVDILDDDHRDQFFAGLHELSRRGFITLSTMTGGPSREQASDVTLYRIYSGKI